MGPADSRRIPRVLRYSGAVSFHAPRFAYAALTPFGPGFHPVPLRPALPSSTVLLPRRRVATPPVWAPPLSLAATGGIICVFSFPAGTEMFQFPALAPASPVPGRPGGFPHSDIRGSFRICRSPRLFAACHVLLRLREPQASPMRPSSLSLCFFLSPRRVSPGGARSLCFLDYSLFFLNVSVPFRVCIMSMDSKWRITDSNR